MKGDSIWTAGKAEAQRVWPGESKGLVYGCSHPRDRQGCRARNAGGGSVPGFFLGGGLRGGASCSALPCPALVGSPALLCSSQIKLLEYFQNYMSEHLLKAGANVTPREGDELARLPYLLNWFRTRSAIVLHLSNGTVQVNFFQVRSGPQSPLWEPPTREGANAGLAGALLRLQGPQSFCNGGRKRSVGALPSPRC